MPALMAGVRAPDISLKSLEGQGFSLKEALKKGPVVAAFYKVSCPVCQMAFPYVERLFRAYGNRGKLTLVGVSQDGAADTKDFNHEFGVTFPVLLDEKGYPVSNAYKLTNVPTVFLISQDGEINTTIVSWSKAEMEDLNKRLAAIAGVPPVQLFQSRDQAPDFRPG